MANPAIEVERALPERAPPTFTVSDRYLKYLLTLFMVIPMVAWMDRNVFTLLLEVIRKDLGLSDTQMGAVTGPAVGIASALVSLPIAWLADRSNRRNIMAVATAIWSVMTAITGLATGFGTLILARMGVGVGVSAGAPIGSSLVGDYFPAGRRASALAILGLGLPLGSLLGYLIGGWITQFFGWRPALMIVAAPGLILALIFWLTVREPPRGHQDAGEFTGPPATLWSTVRHFIRRPALRHMPIAGLLYSISAFGGAMWTPAYFMRVHGMTPAEVGTWFAFIIGGAGTLGTLLGGFGADRIVKRTGDPRWYMWISSAAILAAVPFAFFTFLTSHPIPAMLGMIVPMLFTHMFLGPSGATLISLAGVKRRAMAVALNFFFINLVSVSLGPLVIGMVSDAFKAQYGNASLRYAILTLIAVANVWSALHYFLAARTLREDLAHANDE